MSGSQYPWGPWQYPGDPRDAGTWQTPGEPGQRMGGEGGQLLHGGLPWPSGQQPAGGPRTRTTPGTAQKRAWTQSGAATAPMGETATPRQPGQQGVQHPGLSSTQQPGQSGTQQPGQGAQQRPTDQGQAGQAAAAGTETAPSGIPPSVPHVDIVEQSDSLLVSVDLPGFDEDQIGIQADERTLFVTAERSDDLEEGETVYLRERPLHVQRAIDLPIPTVVEDATASCEDGVCVVTLPKSEESLRKEIAFQ